MNSKVTLKDVSLTPGDLDPTGLTPHEMSTRGWDLTAPWVEMNESALFQNLQAGLHFHLGNLNEAIHEIVRIRIYDQIQIWSSDPLLQVPDKVLKKLTNSVTSPGETGRTRTREAISEIPGWDQISTGQNLLKSYDHMSLENRDMVNRFKSLAIDVCPLCEKKCLGSDALVSFIYDEAPSENQSWHAECFAELCLRFIVQDFKSTKTALDKQGKCSRAILNANEESFASLSTSQATLVKDRFEYENWIWGLYKNWTATTAVNKSYWVTYFNYFKEFADQIVEYVSEQRIPIEATIGRLSKHLPGELVQEVVDHFVEHSGETLKYFGFTDESKNRNLITSVAQFALDNKNSSPYEQAIEKDLEWTEQALCAETSPEVFFPSMGGSITEAKKICKRCAVQAQCLTYALENSERFGVWGGLSDRERARIARNPRKLKKFLEDIQKQDVSVPSKVSSATPKNEIFKIQPKSYSEARIIGEKFRSGSSVLVDLTAMSKVDTIRVMDFVEGIVYGQGGKVENITDEIFLITGANMVLSTANFQSPKVYEKPTPQKIAEVS
jgi:WhiB family redox-sensing transcriptional regulator